MENVFAIIFPFRFFYYIFNKSLTFHRVLYAEKIEKLYLIFASLYKYNIHTYIHVHIYYRPLCQEIYPNS